MPSTSVTTPPPTTSPPAQRVSIPLTFLLAIACGLGAANIYWNQPLLGQIARYFHASDSAAAWVATMAAVGYGVGILFFVPLGDILERRKLIVVLTACAAAACAIAALAPSLWLLAAAHLLLGMSTVTAQVVIPYAVDLVPARERGRIVGILMSGLLVGILLARTLSGWVGAAHGWRAMYDLAAILSALLAVVLRLRLPVDQPTGTLAYPALMKSLATLVKDHPPLRRAGLVGGLSFAAFMAFWTCIVFFMEGKPYLWTSRETGLLGVVGVVGALGATGAGRLSDRHGPRVVITLGMAVTAASFALMWTGRFHLPLLLLAIVLMDLGVQAVQVANQTLIFVLVPGARNRLNTVYMVMRFAGGAAGSSLGAYAWAHHAWPGVCTTGLVLTALGLVIAVKKI